MSERNGRICCLRVIVVKLADGQTAAELPHQSELRISTHDAVHRGDHSSSWGAYIAEILGASFMGRDVLVGDGQGRSGHSSSSARFTVHFASSWHSLPL